MPAGQLVADFRRAWPQLTLTDLISQAAVFVVFAPLVALLLRLFLVSAGEPALANTGNLWFLMRPAGLLAVMVVGAVVLGVIFAEAAGLQLIAFAAAQQRRLTWNAALKRVVAHAVPLFRLGVRVLLRLAILTAPFAAGLALVGVSLLTEYDINYYLATRPPEFWKAMILAGMIGVPLAAILVWRLVSWAFVLPLLLIAGVPVSQVLRRSETDTRGRRGMLALWLVGVLAGNGLLAALVGAAIGLAGRLIIPDDIASMTVVAGAVAIILVLETVATLGLTVVRRSLLSLLIVRLWISSGGQGRLPDTEPLSRAGSRAVPGRRLLVLAAAAVAVTAVGSVLFVQTVGDREGPVVAAHRGASSNAPENTLAALRRGVADGADWVEIDVQESADGTVVVLHDSDLARVGATDLKIWDATDAQLAQIDIGSWFAREFSAERVPTLEQALLACKDRAGVLIELKYYGHTQRLEERVVEIVESLEMVGQISIMSLELSGIQKIRALRPDWPVGLLGTVVIGDPTRLDVDFLAFTARAASRSLIRRAHTRGQRVLVWTVNDPVQMSMLASSGVDGLITDRPAVARLVLAQRAEMTPVERLLVDLGGRFGILEGGWESSERSDA